MFFKKMLTDKLFWKSTLLLALPIAFQNLLTNSFSLIDNIMIGKLSDLAISAVGMANQITFLLNVYLFGMCSGGMIFIAQYWGAGNISGIKRTYGVLLLNCMALGILFFSVGFFAPEFCLSLYSDNPEVIQLGAKYLKYASFSYLGISLTMAFSCTLRSTEKVWAPLFSNIFAVIANIFFNYVLIFGKMGFPELGVQGAAIATIAAALINPILIILFSLRNNSVIISPIREVFSFSLSGLKNYYKISLPVFFNELLWATGMTLYNSIFGHMSEKNFAAIIISRTVENIVFVLFLGLCNACAVLVGKYIGLNKIEQAKEYAKRFLFIVPFFGFILGSVVILMRNNILNLFNITDEVRQVAYILLLVYGLGVGLKNINYISIVGIFRAGGDTKTGMIFDLASLWGLGLPITFICGIIFELDFVLVYILMFLSEELIKTVFTLRYFFKMKWIKPVKQDN